VRAPVLAGRLTHASAQSLAGATYDAAMKLALSAAVVQLQAQVDELLLEKAELQAQQAHHAAYVAAVKDIEAASIAAAQALRADLDRMQEEHVAFKAEMEARLARMEATLEVRCALLEQLANTRIRELLAENAMLHALLDAQE
jgi:hypothetical protein